MTKHPIFYDPKNKRAGRVSRAAWALAIMSSVAGLVFLSSLFIFRSFPETLQTSPSQRFAALNDVAKAPHLLPSVRNLARKAQSTRMQYPHLAKTKAVKPSAERREKPLAIGFYANWDDGSFASLRNNIQYLDWVVPSWLYLQAASMELQQTLDARALEMIRREKPGAQIMAMIQNSSSNTWDGPNLGRLMADPDRRRDRLEKIVAFIESNKLQGIVIDFEQIPDDAHKDTLAFLAEVKAAFKPHGWTIAVAAPFDDPKWNYKAYAKACDYLMLMGYDEHWAGGDPGPVSSQAWFSTRLAARMRDLDPAHTIVAIGNYGYDWTTDGGYADDLTFQEAMLTARDAKAAIDFDPETLSPRYSYVEDGRVHRVWFLDAVTAYNHLRAADKYRPAGYALWRLGAEDPSIWQVLSHNYGAPPPQSLETITPTQDVNFIGRGELLQIAAEPTPGSRSFKTDEANATITGETYLRMPASFVIRRGGETPGKISLTFDDGPSPDWTPKILDILKEKGVHATFFVIGENGAAHPRLVQRVLAEGHDLGNHTFTHPNLGETSDSVAGVELNATQRLIEALTGRSTRLFRPPYFGDAEPTSAQEIAPMEVAEKLGYLTVGLKIDPDDWQKPSADEIVQRVVAQATDPDPEKRGQIVLLHDAGGDRSATVEALPRFIDALRAKGFEFETVSELAKWSRDQAMPPVPADEASPVVNRYVFFTWSWLQESLTNLFLIAIGLGVARLLVLCGLALLGRARAARLESRPTPTASRFRSLFPPITRRRSLRRRSAKSWAARTAMLASSSSTTARRTAPRRWSAPLSRTMPRVKLIATPNSGKASAINARASARARRHRRRARRRHPIRAAHHIAAGPLVRRSESRRRRWQRKGRKPHQYADALAGARIYHGAEP